MNKEEKPWIRIYDEWGDPDGSIVGNRAGLNQLTEKINQALEEEKASVDDIDCDFEGIRLQEAEPEKKTEGPKSAKDLGCLILIGVAVFVFILGLVKISEILGY